MIVRNMRSRAIGGFKLRGKLVKMIYKWRFTIRPRRTKPLLEQQKRQQQHQHVVVDPGKNRNPITKVLGFAKCLRRRARQLKHCGLFHHSKQGYVPLEHDPERYGSGCKTRPGYLAVYVGESQDEAQRYMVPVIYFNHPLFGDLLKEAERVFGFNHPGRITIPCGHSEFEKVQLRIASGAGNDSLRRRIKHGQYAW